MSVVTHPLFPKAPPTLPDGAHNDAQQQTQKSARDFESMTINQMLQPMFETEGTENDMFSGGAGEKQFKPMLIEQIAKSMENNGGIGLRDALQKQMLAMQEHA